MATPFRAVFFDVGETLVYAHPSAEEIMAGICRKWGAAVTPQEIDRALSKTAPQVAQRQRAEPYSISRESSDRFWQWVYTLVLAEVGVPEQERPALARRLHERFSALETWRLYPDTVPALQALYAQGLVLGVVSNWEDWLETLLIRLEIDRYFSFLLSSASVRSEKPDAAIFQEALRLARVEPARALHVGDSLAADVSGARAVGIAPVLLDRRGRYRSERLDGFLRVESLAELPALLERGAA